MNLSTFRLWVYAFLAALSAGCARDIGRANCSSFEATNLVLTQIKSIFAADAWSRDRVQARIFDVRTVRLDEGVALASCQATLGLSPPSDAQELLDSLTGTALLDGSGLVYRNQERLLLAPISFESQRTDDSKVLVISNLAGHLSAIKPIQDGILRQPLLVDGASLLSTDEAKRLHARLSELRLQLGLPIYVETILELPTSPPQDIEDFVARRVTQWKLSNGVLILLAKKDRQIRLQPVGSVRERITGARAGKLIQDFFLPPFKAGNFATGLEGGVNAVATILHE